ncbi:MAG: hypothetical protein HOI95_24755 [Chromatiales bacterium]|jgi:alpha-ketoglutarate-dependent taurine dioxygenase|nr:hypothetical protein [Chromatiales bacterium]
MALQSVALNKGFGAVVNDVTPANLADPAFQADAKAVWVEYRGLLAVRGERLRDLQPEQLVAWPEVFGRVEREGLSAREWSMVEGQPILRIGYITDEEGNPRARFARVEPLTSDADIRYNPATRRPVWHTDSTFKRNPPIGSVFHCKQAPPSGAIRCSRTLVAHSRRSTTRPSTVSSPWRWCAL